jgi:hypothetical protein
MPPPVQRRRQQQRQVPKHVEQFADQLASIRPSGGGHRAHILSAARLTAQNQRVVAATNPTVPLDLYVPVRTTGRGEKKGTFPSTVVAL